MPWFSIIVTILDLFGKKNDLGQEKLCWERNKSDPSQYFKKGFLLPVAPANKENRHVVPYFT